MYTLDKFRKNNVDFQYSSLQLRRKLDELISNRTALDWHWGSIEELCRPSKRALNYFLDKSTAGTLSSDTYRNASNLPNFIYDNQGSVNSLLLSSYLHSSLTNPHDEWMSLQSEFSPSMVLLNKKVNEGNNALETESQAYMQSIYMQACSDQMHLNWRDSNFHQEIFMYYKSLVDIGTSCLGVYQDKNKEGAITFMYKPMSEVYFCQDSQGFPNHVFCLYKWTARQIIDYFARGWNEGRIRSVFNERILKCYKEWSNDIFTFVHAVYPNYSQPDKFISSYFMYETVPSNEVDWKLGFYTQKKSNDVFLLNDNLDYNPYLISRIRKDGLFGVGFSDEAYPLLVQIQNAQRSILIASKKNIEPPMNIPGDRAAKSFSTAPNSKNPTQLHGTQMVGASPSIPQINIRDMVLSKQELKVEIDKIYMIDKIIMESTKRDRTATEVQKKTGEEIKLLSPFIGSLESEFLMPLGKITFSMLKKSKNTFISEAFKELDKIGIKFKYISDIATAQTLKQVDKLMELYQRATIMAEKDPEVKLKIDWTIVFDLIVKNMNVNRLVIKSPDEFNQSLQQMQEALTQEQQLGNMQAMNQASQSYKALQEGEAIRQQIPQ